jgi:uncharacterized protein YacL
MNVSLAFLRIFFFILSIFFMTVFMLSVPGESTTSGSLIGIVIGALFGLFLIGVDFLFKKFNLRSFNIAVIGMFIGYLMGQALVLIFDAILDISSISIVLQPQTLEMINIGLFLFGIYLGAIMTMRSSDELYVSIPFVKFSPTGHKKKDLLLDASVLADVRIIDLATTGILDSTLIIPRFVIKELYAQSEIGDEISKSKAKRSLETIKKLEQVPSLEIRFNDTDFPEVKDFSAKLTRLARLLDANLLTADINRIQMASLEGIRIINMHALSNALKPLMQAGEFIKIKIQRYGKEPRQGVGYLEDGTMVVVNGGGNSIGETIDAKVLSVKHTTSGRMIFCNACDDQGRPYEEEEEVDDEEK